MPKYLKELHYFNCTLLTYTAPLQLHNIISVLVVLITRSLVLQNNAKIETNFYNFNTDGAIRTISSANANMNKFKVATVKSLHYVRV